MINIRSLRKKGVAIFIWKKLTCIQQTSTSRGYRRGSVTGDCDSLMSGYALRYKRLGWPILPYTISTRTNCVLTQYSR